MTQPRSMPAWMNELHPIYQAIAKRVLKAAGNESHLRVVAEALPKRAKGRPPTTSTRVDDLMAAARLYVTTPGATRTTAAGKIYDGLPTKIAGVKIERVTYTNQLAALLKKMPEETLEQIAEQAFTDGLSVREDLFPALAHFCRAKESIAAHLAQLAARQNLFAKRLNDVLVQNAPLQVAEARLAKFQKERERFSRIQALCEAFPEALHDDLPISQVSDFYEWIAGVAAERFEHKKP